MQTCFRYQLYAAQLCAVLRPRQFPSAALCQAQWLQPTRVGRQRTLCGSPRAWLSERRLCLCAKPQARWVLLPATALPRRRAKGTWLEVKALKQYFCAKIHTLKSLTEPPGLPAIQPYGGLASQAAVV